MCTTTRRKAKTSKTKVTEHGDKKKKSSKGDKTQRCDQSKEQVTQHNANSVYTKGLKELGKDVKSCKVRFDLWDLIAQVKQR